MTDFVLVSESPRAMKRWRRASLSALKGSQTGEVDFFIMFGSPLAAKEVQYPIASSERSASV